MRIALVVAGGVDPSGRERVMPVLLSFIERLARNHELHVFALRQFQKPCTYHLLGATVHDLGRAHGPTGLRSLLQARHLVRALRRAGRFDILHGYWAVPAGMVAALAGRWLGIPTIVTFNSGELVSLPQFGYGLQGSWRGRQAVSMTARLATRVHVCSDYMERLATGARLPVHCTIPFGVDVRRFQRAREIAAGPPWRLLHVASLNPVKDQATLIRALARVVDRLDVRLDVVGEDTMGGAVQAQSVALGLEGRVSFHGFQPTDRLAAFYERAHLLVVSSRHEAAGVVVLEAAVSGVPAIGTAAGYIADWMPSGAHGVAAGDDRALAEGIVMLLGDPARRAHMAAAAERRARALDADWTANAIEQLYRSVLQQV